ncbi:MAG: DMT family transporter [Oligosphaeraceae bacterium]|nr:DMT family transporter [Oligosphaeraceae bacterium]
MTLIGILCGLAASLFMAVAFISSSRALRLCKSLSSLGLLARGHILMGCLSLFGLLLFWQKSIISDYRNWLLVTVYGVLFYLCGQACLFMAQRKVDSSRVVPLLGLKLVILALANAFLFRTESYGFMQIIAIACTILSAFILNNAGRRIPLTSFLWVVAACCGYSFSDICIKKQMDLMGQAATNKSLLGLSMFSSSISYTMCGMVGLIMLPFLKRQKAKVWKLAAPFAVAWMAGIVFLFACFQQIGTVNGNIVQSTRGVWAVLLGVVLSKAGQTYLEEKVPWNIVMRRFLAAAMLVVGILLYNWK